MIYHTHHLIQYNHHFIQCKNNLIHYQRSRINNDLNLIQHYIFQIRMPESTAAQPAHKKAVKFIVDEPSEVSQKPAILASQSSSIPKESHVHNGDSKTVMSKNDTSAVLAADVGDEEHFPKYQDDQLPDGVDVPKLNKRYRALPEEFYTKTSMAPITPKNSNKWLNRTEGKGLRWHFWEMFSGTGRLSLVMFMAGLFFRLPV